MIEKNKKEESAEKADPLVSVIMPAFQVAGYIEKAIESVFRQDVSLELIVIDDCSQDGLEEVMKKYSDYGNVIYLKNKKNMGVAASRNRGVAAASGRYIAFLDSDDWWEAGKLSKQLKVMEKEHVVLCSTGRELMEADGNSTGKIIPVKEVLSYRRLLYGNSINCSSVIVRAEAAREYPMLHDDSHEDYITWLKILKKYGSGRAINEPLLKYRLSENGKSRNKIKSARMTFAVYRYMGYGYIRSACFFTGYALNGIKKYL
ncbi:glycosyltransferase family 2 protein [Anaerobium acetethylicum]|uniref:Teichuronic acid biosynthesis glycosyltransferase TuaG n=1 Tax=Anaerobium acetethylicum TaxID=1619234 RepID=A0A1D3TQB1_9FIRM|nr:glycosyltransferase family 2 protein [Anaerobium acetethylicum]SCP95744.1 teichuronic acid biosynthesis glycosyltransferase TuaG [Anaerobium acetethylicum]